MDLHSAVLALVKKQRSSVSHLFLLCFGVSGWKGILELLMIFFQLLAYLG